MDFVSATTDRIDIIKSIPVRELQEWAIALDEIARPSVRFSDDFQEMQREAIMECQRLALSIAASLSRYL